MCRVDRKPNRGLSRTSRDFRVSRGPVLPSHRRIRSPRAGSDLGTGRTDRTATHAAAAGRRGSGRSRRMGMRIGASAADPGPRMDAARSLRGARPSAPGRRRERPARPPRARGDAGGEDGEVEDRTASPFTSVDVGKGSLRTKV